MISLNKVNKYFFKGKQNEIHVINDITLDLPEKGMVAFFGKSGCGKTTLLNTIGGLDSFADGIIQIDGKSIKENTDLLRNKYMGYIFQNYNLNLNSNNFENVAESLRLCGMTDEEEIKRRVMLALSFVGLDKYALRMPDTLSGGQKQRIAIARAVVKNPAVILADEPTGNLDEKNTIMIMNLLKSIAKDHLVLLVTHESNLVDYYCDKVIELSDGKIVNIKNNADAKGYVARDKNAVYLGEYAKNETELGGVSFEYYGEAISSDIKVQLVNQNGTILLKVNSPDVKLLDDGSETVFKSGTFEEIKEQEKTEDEVDLSGLTPIDGTKYGKLFTFKKSAKESFVNLMRKQKTTNTGLRRVMMFFAMLITLLLAVQGRNIESYIQADRAYNHNTFYVYATNKDLVEKLYDALDNNSYGIDYVGQNNNGVGDINYIMETDTFETFKYYGGYYDEDQSPVIGHGVTLPQNLAEGYNLLYGKNTELSIEDIVITKRLAEIMVEGAKLGYIKNIDDLLGANLKGYNGRIAGIVDNDEPAAYISQGNTDNDTSVQIMIDDGRIIVVSDSKELESGEIVVVSYIDPDEETIQSGDTIQFYGTEFKVKEIKSFYSGKTIEDVEEYILNKAGIKGKIISTNLVEDSYELEIQSDDGEIYNYYMERDEYESFIPSEEKHAYYMIEKDYQRLANGISRSQSQGYFVVHTTDVSSTEEFLDKNFSGLSLPTGVKYSLKRPSDIRAEKMKNVENGMNSSLVIACVITVLLCLCMYMVMRSNIMSRVREIGVYRCIGVTRRNMTFRSGVEAFMLTNLSVLPGFLIVSGLIYVMNNFTALDMNIFMPVWLGLPLIVMLYIVCIICGTIPTLTLLTRTPSQIMAKYDV